jgi:hypothetical protein
MRASQLNRLPLPRSTKNELIRQLKATSTLGNEVKTDLNLVLAKLDDDGGVTDTDYEATHAIGSTSISLT